jgi:hypothetical protein
VGEEAEDEAVEPEMVTGGKKKKKKEKEKTLVYEGSDTI